MLCGCTGYTETLSTFSSMATVSALVVVVIGYVLISVDNGWAHALTFAFDSCTLS